MPTAPPRACTQPGCSNLVYEFGQSRCEAHRRNRATEQARGSASHRGYDARWRKIRLIKLQRHPICADPYHLHDGIVVQATEVDHILPLARGGTHALRNLQSLCKSCHSIKTNREDGGGWQGRGSQNSGTSR